MERVPLRRLFQKALRSARRVPLGIGRPLESDAQTIFESAGFSGSRVLLESARTHPVTGRYSLIVGEPTVLLAARGDRVEIQTGDDRQFLQADPLRTLGVFSKKER